jgi:hypothetical protein
VNEVWHRSCSRLQHDTAAHALELADGPVAGADRVASGEVVAAQVLVVAVLGEQVAGDDEAG